MRALVSYTQPALYLRTPPLAARGGVRSVPPAARLAFGMHPRTTIGPQEIALDDILIVRRMADGDTAALGAFYDRWSAEAYITAIAIVRVEQDAEEVVEDAFWQAWTQALRFDVSRGTVRSWLMSITRSRALDRLKAVMRRRENHFDDAPPQMLVNEDRADDHVLREERTSVVATAMRALPRVQREALEMAYFGGLSQTEISDCTGLPVGTVKTRIRLGMQKLREHLAPAGETAS